MIFGSASFLLHLLKILITWDKPFFTLPGFMWGKAWLGNVRNWVVKELILVIT